MSTSNPIALQKHVRDNSQDIQNFLNDLSSWSTHMKAKELAESGADLQPMDKVPLRSDPQKQTKERENRTTKSEGAVGEDSAAQKKRISAGDYASWEKFDVEKACEEVDKDNEIKEEESEEQKIKRKAITLRLQAVAAEKKDQENQYLKEKNYEKAIECYTEGLRCDKTNALLFSNRAQAYLFDKQFSKAIDDCTESIRHDSTYVKSYFRRAKALTELGRLTEAKNDLSQALRLDPKNSEVRNLLNDLNRKTQVVKAGPKKATPNSMFPGIRTMFTSRSNPYAGYDDDYDDEITKKPEVTEVYPKKITPISKPPNRRSKRPLLPIHVKLIGGKDKKLLKLDSKSFDGSLSSSNSFDGGDTSSISSPATDYSNAPTPPLSAISTNSLSPSPSLPTLFSKLQMAMVPPKPKTAAQFTQNWKQIKSNPDVLAQYLNQLDANDYLIFQDSMEYSIMSDILDLLVWEFLSRKWDIIKHLVGLTKIRRFSTLLLFMTEKDRANVRKLLSECPSEMQELLSPKYEI